MTTPRVSLVLAGLELARIGALGAILLSAGAALGETSASPSATTDTPASRSTSDPSRSSLNTRRGVSMTLGVGATDFISQATRRATVGTGAYMDARVSWGTRSLVGVEGAFHLSTSRLARATFSGENPTIWGHGLEAALRLNLPMHRGRLLYSPFAVAGLGWTLFVRTDEATEDALNHRVWDQVGVVPVGLGLAIGYGHFHAEARVMYRATYGVDQIPTASDTANLQSWSAGLAGGVEF
jgi:hypothetical protein